MLENESPVFTSTTSSFADSYSAFHAASDAVLAAFSFCSASLYAASAPAAVSEAATASEIVVGLNVPSSGFACSAASFAASYSACAAAASACASESDDGCAFAFASLLSSSGMKII